MSEKCEKCFYKFPQLNMRPSNCLFCPTNSSKPKNKTQTEKRRLECLSFLFDKWKFLTDQIEVNSLSVD